MPITHLVLLCFVGLALSLDVRKCDGSAVQQWAADEFVYRNKVTGTTASIDTAKWKVHSDGTIRPVPDMTLCLVDANTNNKIPTCKDSSISSYPYCDTTLPAEERAADLVSRMTLDEKLAMVGGTTGSYTGNIPGNTRLGIPNVNMNDGPQGVGLHTMVTCWPSGLTVAQSWDSDMFHAFGKAMGEEHRGKGSNVMLGPMNNIARVPQNGRNFESAGEDPVLASVFAREVITGVQENGVLACDKHFANNNQEYQRNSISVEVDERTQWELYYPHFKAAVDAGVGSIMCSYNRINGTFACENNKTLNVDLKEKMGFKGYVVSDWMATHSTALAVNSGLDIEMPRASHFAADLIKADIELGLIEESRINDMVKRIVYPMLQLGQFDNENTGTTKTDVTSDEHNELARKLSEAGTVLLKNGGILPLATSAKIAVIGKVASDSPIISGGGSGAVKHKYLVTPLDGIKAQASNVIYNNAKTISEAVKAAAESDIAVVVVGFQTSEGVDRKSLNLGGTDDKLIEAIAAKQPNTVVVVNNAGAFLTPWADKVAAILVRGLPGQEDGNALANVLFGKTNPAGKLPVSFPKSLEDTWLTTPIQYPGIDGRQEYSEGLYIGYRWYDSQNTVPSWPFGHGLSYTTFEYSEMFAEDGDVSFTLTNTGKVEGSEVSQLYVSFPESAKEPPKLLKAFEKVTLAAGQSKKVTFKLTERDLSVYDVVVGSWVPVKGHFMAHVGSSSTDIRLTEVFNI